MRQITAIIGWFTEVTIQVSDEESPEHIHDRLCERAVQELLHGNNVMGPDIVECSDENLVDK